MSIQTDTFADTRILTGKPVSPNEEAVERALRPRAAATKMSSCSRILGWPT